MRGRRNWIRRISERKRCIYERRFTLPPPPRMWLLGRNGCVTEREMYKWDPHKWEVTVFDFVVSRRENVAYLREFLGYLPNETVRKKSAYNRLSLIWEPHKWEVTVIKVVVLVRENVRYLREVSHYLPNGTVRKKWEYNQGTDRLMNESHISQRLLYLISSYHWDKTSHI